MKATEVKAEPQQSRWTPFSFAQPFAKVFYCNSIVFVNKGTQDVVINDIFILKPLESISLNSDKNEIDTTVYKGKFTLVGGIIAGWYKTNVGIEITGLELPYTKDKAKIPNRRTSNKETIKESRQRKRTKDF